MVIGPRTVRLAALAAGTAGGLSGAAYGLLNGQSWYAHRVIGVPANLPLRADGAYMPDEYGPVSPTELDEPPLRLALLGDSTATGLGVDRSDELPGVVLARGLAAEAERPVELRTHAVVGSTSRDLQRQVEAVLVDPPQLALVLIGANDVTSRYRVATCAELLGRSVSRLTAAGVAVVVGTCPDLGAVRAIPQPLRAAARSWSLALAKAQREAVNAAGGTPVPLADLLAPEFLTRSELFSRDRYHPSATGYAEVAKILLPTMAEAIGAWIGGPLPSAPVRSTAAEARRPTARIVAQLNRQLRRRRG